jgi:hypothetical protein
MAVRLSALRAVSALLPRQIFWYSFLLVARGSVVFKAQCYKPEGRGCETLPAALGLEFTEPLTEMSTRNIKKMFLGSKVRPVRGADSLTTI